jgi:hypothetical protein
VRCDPGLSAGERRKSDRRQTNDRDRFSGSRTIAYLHRFNGCPARGCHPFRRPRVRNRAHASGSRKTARNRAGNSARPAGTAPGGTSRKGNSKGRHEAPENPTAKRRARASSFPSVATAKTRSNTGTRDQHGFLTQEQKCLWLTGAALPSACALSVAQYSYTIRSFVSGSPSRTSAMSKRTRKKKLQSLSNPRSPMRFRLAASLPHPTLRLAS